MPRATTNASLNREGVPGLASRQKRNHDDRRAPRRCYWTVLRALGISDTNARQWACLRKGYWRIAGSSVSSALLGPNGDLLAARRLWGRDGGVTNR